MPRGHPVLCAQLLKRCGGHSHPDDLWKKGLKPDALSGPLRSGVPVSSLDHQKGCLGDPGHLLLSLQQTDTWSLRHRPGLSGFGTAGGNREEEVSAENHPLVLGYIRPSSFSRHTRYWSISSQHLPSPSWLPHSLLSTDSVELFPDLIPGSTQLSKHEEPQLPPLQPFLLPYFRGP